MKAADKQRVGRGAAKKRIYDEIVAISARADKMEGGTVSCGEMRGLLIRLYGTYTRLCSSRLSLNSLHVTGEK